MNRLFNGSHLLPVPRKRKDRLLARIGVALAASALVIPSTVALRAPAASATSPTGPGLGQQRFYPMVVTGLTDRMSFKVNVANGNLVVDNRDFAMRGTTFGLELSRTYNSQGSGGSNT